MSKKQPNPKKKQLSQQIEELTEALQRERADVINIRRRQEEQISSLKDVVKVQVVSDLLPVIDNFERALKHVPKELEENDYIKGVGAVVKHFEKTLNDMGVTRIKTVGESFNPELHEAVGVEQDNGDQEIVAEELQSGYQMKDIIIRHAMVRVSKK